MKQLHISDLTELIYYKKENRIKVLNENIQQLSDRDRDSLLYSAGSFGDLEVVKWFLEEFNLKFNEDLHGCSREEYVFMAACHPEGKDVRHYLLKGKGLKLSQNVLSWMEENKLGRLIPKDRKLKP